MNKEEYIKNRLSEILNKQIINHRLNILKEKNLKNAHIYCKINNLSSQSYGSLLEFYILKKYKMNKNKNYDCNGDLYKNKENLEIKTSLGGKNCNRFNFVQLRLNHLCKYIFTCYFLTKENLNKKGELFIFKLEKEDLKKLIIKYGNYAHGTISKLGKISKNNILENIEYSLRPKYNDKLWKDLLFFRIQESDI